jgi:hypothetical protein
MWWEIESEQMKGPGFVVDNGVTIFSGELISAGTLQQHFSTGVSQTKESWDDGLDSAIYQHLFSKGCSDGEAWAFSGKIGRALTTEKLEVVYKKTSSKSRVLGLRCTCCNQAVVMDYSKNHPGETMAMLRLVLMVFLGWKPEDVEGGAGASSKDDIGKQN